jgi:hypothetical protein
MENRIENVGIGQNGFIRTSVPSRGEHRKNLKDTSIIPIDKSVKRDIRLSIRRQKKKQRRKDLEDNEYKENNLECDNDYSALNDYNLHISNVANSNNEKYFFGELDQLALLELKDSEVRNIKITQELFERIFVMSLNTSNENGIQVVATCSNCFEENFIGKLILKHNVLFFKVLNSANCYLFGNCLVIIQNAIVLNCQDRFDFLKLLCGKGDFFLAIDKMAKFLGNDFKTEHRGRSNCVTQICFCLSDTIGSGFMNPNNVQNNNMKRIVSVILADSFCPANHKLRLINYSIRSHIIIFKDFEIIGIEKILSSVIFSKNKNVIHEIADTYNDIAEVFESNSENMLSIRYLETMVSFFYRNMESARFEDIQIRLMCVAIGNMCYSRNDMTKALLKICPRKIKTKNLFFDSEQNFEDLENEKNEKNKSILSIMVNFIKSSESYTLNTYILYGIIHILDSLESGDLINIMNDNLLEVLLYWVNNIVENLEKMDFGSNPDFRTLMETMFTVSGVFYKLSLTTSSDIILKIGDRRVIQIYNDIINFINNKKDSISEIYKTGNILQRCGFCCMYLDRIRTNIPMKVTFLLNDRDTLQVHNPLNFPIMSNNGNQENGYFDNTNYFENQGDGVIGGFSVVNGTGDSDLDIEM